MGRTKFYCAGTTKAARYGAEYLRKSGISFAREPDLSVTDLLLDIPSFDSRGNLRDGEDPDALLTRLSPDVRIWGGMLDSVPGYQRIDLLKDPVYLAENAAITADCALKIACPLLGTTWKQTRVLIIGWGRIGKQLAKMLKTMGSSVTVCARKASDRALLRAFQYEAAEPSSLASCGNFFDLIYNTAPVFMMDCSELPDTVAIDLASSQGLKGNTVIWARGLPGKITPKASGLLIGQTILRLKKEAI